MAQLISARGSRTAFALGSDSLRLACRSRSCVIRAIALHREIEVIAVGVGAAGLRVRTISRALGRRPDAQPGHAPGDLVLIIDMPSEMVEARRLAVGLVLEQRQRDVAIGHIDRLAA